MKKAIEIAAQCWCDKETQHLVMIPELAEAFAKRIENGQAEISGLRKSIREAYEALNGVEDDVVMIGKAMRILRAEFGDY